MIHQNYGLRVTFSMGYFEANVPALTSILPLKHLIHEFGQKETIAERQETLL